ncbi:MAG: DUF1573 domain-containing protein [Candidatus Omnitrophica bacterium]|nr:DUF1573 domain-containing protein [Candidatus Omnitrophota bacterium]
MKTFKFPFILFLACFLPVFCFAAPKKENSLPRLEVFYSHTCQRCLDINNKLLPYFEKALEGKVVFERRDISDIENYKYLFSLVQKYDPSLKMDIPIFYMKGRLINGDGDVGKNLKDLLIFGLTAASKEERLPEIKIADFFRRFSLPGIIAAGLEDGINPCAFTVIVFFMSYLALQGYRRKELIVIGISFIGTVFLAYFLIGLCIFNFLYALKGFWMVSKAINLGVGILSILLGFFALYDYFKFKKTKDAEGMVLQLPKSVKDRIHSVIGMHYRKVPSQKKGHQSLARLLISAVITGFLVTLLEAVCTGQLYLPTIAFIVKTSSISLRLRALGYLILYNVFFVSPLIVIFLLALFGTTSDQFARFLKRHMASIKIFMALLFFTLGAVIVYLQFPGKEDTPVKLQVPLTQGQDPYFWDFGKVRAGEVLKHTFNLVNNGNTVMKLKRIDTSCGCTLSRTEKDVLAAGQSMPLEVTFNTQGYSGEVEQFVYVYAEGSDSAVFRFMIRADIGKEEGGS